VALRRAVIALCAAALSATAAPAPRTPASADSCLDAVAQRLPAQARHALSQIEGTPRRLLAARGYLRAGEGLVARWSWSQQQVDAYEASDEYRLLLAEIASVTARFEARNPGYSLYANTETRSLDVQIQRWNENAAVGHVAQELQQAASRELAGYPAGPAAAAAVRFAEFLHDWPPPASIPLASPGLSLHGQSRAIDFQVMRAGEVIAPTQIASVASVWTAQGWTQKLKEAVAGSRFVGPLQVPDEPWHYEYQSPSGDPAEHP
jgi:hypothetical protein